MLLQNIEQVSNVININDATSYEKLFPHLFAAEQKYIYNLLGDSLYEKLIVFMNDPESPIIKLSETTSDFSKDFYDETTDKDLAWARVLFVAQRTTVHLAYFEGFHLLNTYVTDGGFHRMQTETTKSLFKYQEDAIRQYYHQNGMDGLDMMLKILEVNITHFSEFADQYKKLRSKIFPKTEAFDAIINIRESRIVFMRLQQSIEAVSELRIASILGKTNYADFINGLAADEIPTKVTKLLPYVQKATAYLASIMLMEETGADLTERGLYFEGFKGGISMNDVKMPADNDRIAALIHRNRNLAEQYIVSLQNFMADNTADWNSYTNPRSYLHNRDNTGKKTFFV